MVMLALSSQWIPAFAGMTDREFINKKRHCGGGRNLW